MNNTVNTRMIVGVLLIAVIVSACVISPPRRLDARFGQAIGMAKAQQTANPDASLNTTAVQGVDGQAGDAMIDNYRNSYINRPAPARGALNVGTSGGSSGGDSGQ